MLPLLNYLYCNYTVSFSYILEETILINTVRLFYLSFLSGEPQEITTQILFVFPRPAEKLPGVNLPPSTSQPLLWWLNFTIIQIRLRERLGYKKKKKKNCCPCERNLLVKESNLWGRLRVQHKRDVEVETCLFWTWIHVRQVLAKECYPGRERGPNTYHSLASGCSIELVFK